MTKVKTFKETILKSIGTIYINEDTENRILIVRDEFNRVRVSAQVWWRNGDTWNPGKGHSFTGKNAITISRVVKECINTELDFKEELNIVSSTQKYEVEKSKGNIEISKWWRKNTTEPWAFSKSLSIPVERAFEFHSMLKTAGLMTLHTR